MADRPVGQLTLREMFNVSQRLSRELIEHVEHGFIPKTHELMRLVEPGITGSAASRVQDVTVRNHVANILESEIYTDEVYTKLEQHCTAIDALASRIVTG